MEGVEPRDADAPGYFDLRLDLPKLQRALAGSAVLARLVAKHRGPVAEVIRTHKPGAYRDPGSGEVTMNAGYDPAHDEGQLEEIIWELAFPEVEALLAPQGSGQRRTRRNMRQ